MSTTVYRVRLDAKPKDDHDQFFGWQTARICILVAAPDGDTASAVSRQELRRRKWSPLSELKTDLLVERRVLDAGGDVLDAYLQAARGTLFFRSDPHHFGTDMPGYTLLSPARIDERFMDSVIEAAGGRRLSAEEIPEGCKNADYLLDDYIFELKDLQEEGLTKEAHQRKLSELFAPYFPGESTVQLDPSLLSKPDLQTYLDIIGTPIKTHVKSASKQVKATRDLLGRPELRGGLIVLNTGFSSYPHERFSEQVERYARKDSRQFEAVISITIWMETSGFESFVFYGFFPTEPTDPSMARIRAAFDAKFIEMMTDLMRAELAPDTERVMPRSPVAFEANGVVFNWRPPTVQLPWEKDGK